MKSFIDELEITALLNKAKPEKKRVLEIIQKSLSKRRLELDEVAVLLKIDDRDLLDALFEGAKKLKESVYGNRIVLFAPLYIGNECVNDCRYCAFKSSNQQVLRRTLSDKEIKREIKSLEAKGHKRLILVYGEHPGYNADFIAKNVKLAYATKLKTGEIRRVNINAPPLEVEEYKQLKKVGIGTYQIFQETYHRKTYAYYHPRGKKSDYNWRLFGLDRAQEAGLDDVGIGVLFGLYDWKFEVMGLLAHTIHLEQKFRVGPHTISFPRVQPAINCKIPGKYFVSEEDFKKLVAIIRLSVPYTGMILTAREKPDIRKKVIELGCSQIDAGSRIGLGSYGEEAGGQKSRRQQFLLGDTRTLDEIIFELLENGYIPSFCTSCYRLGRTGEHFMEFAIPGFINEFCTPNAILTLKEYLEDYASLKTKESGRKAIEKAFEKITESKRKKRLAQKLARVESGQRDLYY
jgi:2-iminoacetate synthase